MKQTEHEVRVTHLRDGLGVVCQGIFNNDDAVIVTRYGKGIVAIVPLWEWRFFKQLEADLRAGRKRIIDLEESLEIEWDDAGTCSPSRVTVSHADRRSPRDTNNPNAENDDGDQGPEDLDEEGDTEEGQDQADPG